MVSAQQDPAIDVRPALISVPFIDVVRFAVRRRPVAAAPPASAVPDRESDALFRREQTLLPPYVEWVSARIDRDRHDSAVADVLIDGRPRKRQRVVGARLIPLAYWALLLVGLAVLGRRIGGRWAALAAVAVPLAFTTGAGDSPIQGPADLLGEIPAAALLVWALIVLPRRAWLAGLLVGLAVQAKLIALLAMPAFAVALWVSAPGASVRERFVATLKRSWVPLLFVALPTFLVEVFALVSLGLDRYIGHLRELAWFVRSGGQNVEPTTVAQKLATLAGSWSLPEWAAVVLAVISVILIAGALLTTRGDPSAHTVGLYLWPAAVGALAFVGWWATASHLPLWVRHPAPGVFAFFPILAAATAWACGVLLQGRTTRVLAVVAASALVVGIGTGAALHTVTSTTAERWETLAAQRAAVEPLAAWVDENDAAWLAAQPWGAAVSAIVLSGAHVGLFDAPAMNGIPRLTGAECTTEVLADSGPYRICAAE